MTPSTMPAVAFGRSEVADTEIAESEPTGKPSSQRSEVEPKLAQESTPHRDIPDARRKIHAILSAYRTESDSEKSAAAQALTSLFPMLSAEGQEECARRIVDLIQESDYPRILQIIKNPNAPKEVLEPFIADLRTRDDGLRFPVLLDLAKIPNHPYREEAITDLKLFLGEDHGENWAKWDTAMKTYLATQAAENAAASTTATVPVK